jgi:hypothetical protein
MNLEELNVFLEEKITYLTELRKEYQDNDDWSSDDYAAGAIDAYDIMRMKLTDLT